MNHNTKLSFILILLINTLFVSAQTKEPDYSVSFGFSPKWWQTAINLPESSRKTLVGKNGQLMYEYPAVISDPKMNQNAGFTTIISYSSGQNETWKNQQLLNAQTPIMITTKEWKGLEIKEEAFSVAPLLFGATDSTLTDYLGTALSRKISGKPGNDIVIVTIENKGSSAVSYSPSIKINSTYAVIADTAKGKITVSDFLRVIVPYPVAKTSTEAAKKAGNEKSRNITVLTLKPIQIDAGEKVQLAFGVSQGFSALDCPNNLKQALSLQKQTITYWQNVALPYNKIVVPDATVQNLINASFRNIYQNMETEKGLPVFRSGPSSNRQFSLQDAPFVVDALTMLNQTEDAKNILNNILAYQKSDGAIFQLEKDWKQTGLSLWAMSNYARLSGDKQWLDTEWPRFEKAYMSLIELRNSKLNDKSVTGLLPASGNEQGIDFVNNYWGLSGLNSAITAARWIGRNGQAIKWQSLYDDYYKDFLASVDKNTKKDANGNIYLPVRPSVKTAPQSSQWAFLNAVYPGRIFGLEHPLIAGSMKMLERSIKEGLIVNSGSLNNGLSLTMASDYAQTLQWTGKAQESANVLYAMSNHASPNLAWYEQQPLKGTADTITTGDMPNSRVAADYLRLVRHLIVIERGYDLHLFEGVPSAWTKAGMEIKLDNVLTEFGILNFRVKISDDRTEAMVYMTLNSTNRRTPQKIYLHLDGIAGNPATLELENKPNMQRLLKLD